MTSEVFIPTKHPPKPIKHQYKKQCPYCGVIFITNCSNQKFCSRRCLADYHNSEHSPTTFFQDLKAADAAEKGK